MLLLIKMTKDIVVAPMNLCDIDLIKARVSKSKICYIVASGPSISELPLQFLKAYDTIAVNGAILPLHKHSINPFIHCVFDIDFISKRQSLCSLGLKASKYFVTSDECLDKIKQKNWFSRCQNIVSIPNKTEKALDNKLETGYVEGGTVVAIAIQLAIFLGYKKIFIVGMDLTNDNKRACKELRKRPSYLGQSYESLIKPFFTELSSYIKKNNITVYNNSLKSRLPGYIIPKMPFIGTFEKYETLISVNIITPSVKYGGGMERYVCELIEHLAGRGYQITAYYLKYDRKLFAGNPNVHIKQAFIIRRLPRFLKYLAFAFKVWVNTRKSKAVNIATARIFNADLAIVGGTHKIHNQVMAKKNGLYDLVEIWLEKTMYRHAKCIMAHSELMVEEINAYNLGVEKKIKMCFPPVSKNAFYFVSPKEKVRYRQKLGLPENKYILLTLGGEPRRKGTFYVIEALKQLNRDTFFLAVLGKNAPRDLPENARFFGAVDNVQDYYAAADITVAPSLYEPFGLIVIESLEVGRPVIISKNLGARGFVNQNNGIIVDEISTPALKDAILTAQKKQFICPQGFIENVSLTWKKHIEAIEKILASFH